MASGSRAQALAVAVIAALTATAAHGQAASEPDRIQEPGRISAAPSPPLLPIPSPPSAGERVRVRGVRRSPGAALVRSALSLALSRRRERGSDLILVGNWSAEERSAIERTSERIPDEIRAPATIVRDATGCGDETTLPDDDHDLLDERGWIHLCAPTPGVSPDAIARQVTEARIFAFDRASGWSEDRGWRRLNRWRRSAGSGFALRAANLDPAGFAEPRGRRSPRWDLATYLAALLLDAPGDDGGIGCRLISQARFLRARVTVPIGPARCSAFEEWAALDRLAGVEVVLAAPSTAMLGSLFGHLFLRLCYRDGERDADGGDTTPAHLSRTVAFLADNDMPFTEDPTYAVKGIVGSYAASLHERAFLDVYRDYVVVEGRDLRRWRLNLTDGERRQLLERIWTALHGTKVAYYFFRRNCATLMVDLVDDIRGPAADDAAPGWLAAPPATTLEPWADARGADGAPLLQFVPEPIDSFEHRARDAARHRLALEPALVDALPPGASDRATAALRDVHAPAVLVRASGYQRLGSLLAGAGSAGDLRAWLADSATIETHLSALANLEAEAREDRQRRDRVRAARDAILARLAADARGSRGGDGATSVPAVLGERLNHALDRLGSSSADARLDGYRALLALTRAPGIDPDLCARLRLLALLQSELRFDVVRMKAEPGLREALLFSDPDAPIQRQRYLAGYESLLELPCETRVSPSLLSLQKAKQQLFAARRLASADADGEVPSAAAATVQRQQHEAREYQASLPHSGIDRFALLGALAAGGAGAPRAGLMLSAALYDEQLGDHHRFGFPSDTALVVGRSALFLALGAGTPSIAAYDMRIIGYRSLRAPLPESGSGRWPLGWELYATLEGDHTCAITTAPKLGWGLLAPISDRGELTDHALASLSIAYSAYFPESGAIVDRAAQAISAPLAVELRTGVGAEPRYRSWCAARAWIEPMATLAAGRTSFRSEAGARIEANIHLGSALGSGTRIAGAAHAPALVARAQIVRATLTFTGATAATVALFSAGFDLR